MTTRSPAAQPSLCVSSSVLEEAMCRLNLEPKECLGLLTPTQQELGTCFLQEEQQTVMVCATFSCVSLDSSAFRASTWDAETAKL